MFTTITQLSSPIYATHRQDTLYPFSYHKPLVKHMETSKLIILLIISTYAYASSYMWTVLVRVICIHAYPIGVMSSWVCVNKLIIARPNTTDQIILLFPLPHTGYTTIPTPILRTKPYHELGNTGVWFKLLLIGNPVVISSETIWICVKFDLFINIQFSASGKGIVIITHY